MSKIVKLFALTLVVCMVATPDLLAQDSGRGLAILGKAVGAGLAVIGAGIGLGAIGTPMARHLAAADRNHSRCFRRSLILAIGMGFPALRRAGLFRNFAEKCYANDFICHFVVLACHDIRPAGCPGRFRIAQSCVG